MARLARVVVPDVPHHVTQRGNRRQATFFNEDDYSAYLELMAEWCGRCGAAVWAYCLMPNHVHLIVVPKSEDGLRRGIGDIVGESISGRAGEATCGRDALRRFRWTSGT